MGHRNRAFAPATIVALIVAIAGAPVAGGAQSQPATNIGAMPTALDALFRDVQAQMDARQTEIKVQAGKSAALSSSSASAAQAQLQLIEAIMVARQGMTAGAMSTTSAPLKNDGLNDKLAKAGQLLKTSKEEQLLHATLYTKLQSALVQMGQELAKLKASGKTLDAAQASKIKAQLAVFQAFVKADVAAASKDPQRLKNLASEFSSKINAAKAKGALQSEESAQLDQVATQMSSLSIASQLQMQMLTNQLSQESEMMTSVANAVNAVTTSMARNLKG